MLRQTKMYISHEWKDYEIMDAGGGDKFERWGDVTCFGPTRRLSGLWGLF